jgi:hypothetical protein
VASLSRSISLSRSVRNVGAMREALTKIYHADRIADELTR